MFNFKPRVYRSAEGCCICRAKSSSSRFTESHKYEEDFMKCFALKNPRRGQICNACVLLVKRYKRLPAGSERNWGHVVDARAGPGTKTLMKVKRHREEKNADTNNVTARGAGKSIISERFSKIFKKSKKSKTQTSSPSSSSQNQDQMPILSKQANSVDSDNEDSSESSQELSKTSSAPTIVLFQTQTRASAFRSRHKLINNKPSMQVYANKSKDLTMHKPQLPKFAGSKKRKKFTPKRLEHPFDFDDKVKFFDENEWIKRQTCCGVFYECAKLNGAIIIDVHQYKVCHQHCQTEQIKHEIPKSLKAVETNQQEHINLNLLPKPICAVKATLPTVVKLSLPLSALNSNEKSTPALKKHHLFFKRQSESFPLEDKTTTTNVVPVLAAVVKTEDANEREVDNENDSTTIFQQTQQHSDALSNTIALPASSSTTINPKSSSFLHKIKSDTGRIVKHSFEKLNSAVRLKAHDLAEIKQLTKTVDKSYLLTKTTTTTTPTTPLTTENFTATAIKSAVSLATTTTNTKFNDNSSDSGFDENLQERKSVSPLQQENDTKNILPPRPAVQTLILASGVRVHGQSQNLVYAGNEAAAKILQNRFTKTNNQTILQHNRLNTIESSAVSATSSATIATLKLAQPLPTMHKQSNPNCVVSIGPYGGLKMRALCNNNAIKHENGITTIVPATLAATNQANLNSSLQAKAPNTITITPAVAATTTAPQSLTASQLVVPAAAVTLQNRVSWPITSLHH